MNSTQKPERHIPSLDGLRGISILLVLAGHLVSRIPIHHPLWILLQPYLTNARLGVLTFFVISGYLITYLLRKEWEANERIDLRAFYMRRILRIFPAFYTYIAVMIALCVAGIITIPVGTIASAATFSVNYSARFLHDAGGINFEWLAHFWTLSLEEQFYLLWPPLLAFVGIFRAKRIALLLIIACPIIRVISYFAFPQVRPQLGLMLHSAVDPILIGSLIALLEGNETFESFVKRLSNGYIPLLTALFVCVVSKFLTDRFQGTYQAPIGRTLDGIAVAIIIVWAIRYPTTAIGRILNARVLVFIGVLSYSLYLWQQPFTVAPNYTFSSRFPINLVCVFAAAMISYYAIEKPFLRLKARLSKKNRIATEPAIA